MYICIYIIRCLKMRDSQVELFKTHELSDWKPRKILSIFRRPSLRTSQYISFFRIAKVTTVPVICDGFIQLTAETLEAIPDVWTAQQLGEMKREKTGI